MKSLKIFLLALTIIGFCQPVHASDDAEAAAEANDAGVGEMINDWNEKGPPKARPESKKKKSLSKAKLDARKRAETRCVLDIIDGKPHTEAGHCRRFRPKVEACFERIRARVPLSSFCDKVRRQNFAVAQCKRGHASGQKPSRFCRQFRFVKSKSEPKIKLDEPKDEVGTMIEALEQKPNHGVNHCHKITDSQEAFQRCMEESPAVISADKKSGKHEENRAPAHESGGGKPILSAE